MRTSVFGIKPIAIAAPIFVLALALSMFMVLLTFDAARQAPGKSLLDIIFHADTNTAPYVLTSIAQTLATVVSITITLALIVVQLTANRYTHRLTALFMESKATVGLVGVFLLGIIYALYVAHTLEEGFAPDVSCLVSLAMMTVCLLSVIPYLYHVWVFLEPESIIALIQRQALGCLRRYVRGGQPAAKLGFARSIEQIADLAKGSVRQADTGVALASVAALVELALAHLAHRPLQPESWHRVEPQIFLHGSPTYLNHVENEGVWVEVKALEELRMVYRFSLQESSPVNTAVAHGVRRLGCAAYAHGDGPALRWCVRFLNTLLREGINARERRAIYSVLQEYRLLAEELLDGDPGLAARIADHMRYYAVEAHAAGLGFIPETVAYDLSALCQWAYERGVVEQDALLRVFLRLPEDLGGACGCGQPPLAGVYKAMLALGAFYRCADATALYHRVAEALRAVDGPDLRRLGEELLSATEPEFWEITSRGVNFNYVAPQLRPHVCALLEELRAV